MAAGTIVELNGGTPKQAVNATAIAMKSLLGLVCDPVAGLVEVPCIKRNVIGTSIAFSAADLLFFRFVYRLRGNRSKAAPSPPRERGNKKRERFGVWGSQG